LFCRLHCAAFVLRLIRHVYGMSEFNGASKKLAIPRTA
jgi:hypothetical protein